MAIKLIQKKAVIKLPEESGNIELKPPSMNSYPLYDGETFVIPAVEAQELETENKTVKENIKVDKIPFLEVSNNAGGYTVVIA